ncbi:MAG TPA: cupredoxin family copper-binding protein [Burkholderiales bacterium]|nr:cupredoxin family copper-binding protein [Burkholderiales bacterium]
MAIEGMQFVPARLEVSAGDTVTWTNRDLVPHTVTAAGAGLESGNIAPGASWKFTARRAGAIAYVCRYHPSMKATLVVK